MIALYRIGTVPYINNTHTVLILSVPPRSKSSFDDQQTMMRRPQKRTLLRKGDVRRSFGPFMMGLAVIGVVVLIWTSGALVVSVASAPRAPRILQVEFPRNIMDIWPNDILDSAQDLLDGGFYASCSGSDCDKAALNKVVVLRTPGVLGEVITEYVQGLVPSWEVMGTSDVESIPKEAYVVRLAILPSLLEALDLILQASSNASKEEVVHILRRVLGWHCRVDSAVLQEHLPVLSLTLDEAIAYPKAAKEGLFDFLKVDLDELQISAHAERVLIRISQATKMIDGLDIASEVDTVIAEYLSKSPGSQCDELVTSTSIPESSVCRLLDAFLLPDQDPSLLCNQYPTSALCRESRYRE